jgi:excisionase family DNA binding protein
MDSHGTTEVSLVAGSLGSSLMKDPRLVVSVGEAGAMLGVSRSYAYELVRRGELRAVRLGRRQVVPKVALLELIRYQRVDGDSPTKASECCRRLTPEGPPILPCAALSHRRGV